MSDLEVMIILIEGKYPKIERNSIFKMHELLKKEFNVNISFTDIEFFYGIHEDFEHLNRQIEYGNNNY